MSLPCTDSHGQRLFWGPARAETISHDRIAHHAPRIAAPLCHGFGLTPTRHIHRSAGMRAIWWTRQRLFERPTIRKALFQGSTPDDAPWVSEPLSKGLHLTPTRQHPIISFVHGLLGHGGETAILWGIVAIDIDAFNRQPWLIPMRYGPIAKGFERGVPGRTDGDATAAIDGIIRVARVLAPQTYRDPLGIQRTFRLPMRLLESNNPLTSGTPTRGRISSYEVINPRLKLATTGTTNQTDAHPFSMGIVLKEASLEHRAATKHLAWNNITIGRHTEPLSSARVVRCRMWVNSPDVLRSGRDSLDPHTQDTISLLYDISR